MPSLAFVAGQIRPRVSRARSTRSATLLSLVEADLDSVEPLLLEWVTGARLAEARLRPDDFGLAFLSAATVIARREAQAHNLWPCIAQVCQTGELFRDCQPRREVLWAIDSAVVALGLRHALLRDMSEQRWYLTVLLQCGWTRPSLQLLPEWLAGRAVPRPMELLLHDAELRSESFADTFESARRYRLGQISALPTSPWLGATWLNEAQRHAREHLDLGTSEAEGGTGVAICHLIAGPAGLRFSIDLAVPEDASASGAPHIDLTVGNAPKQTATRQEDGSYALSGSSVVVPLPGGEADETGLVNGRAVSNTGDLLWEEQIELFAIGEDVDLYLAQGGEDRYVRRAAWSETIGAAPAAILRTALDLEVRGAMVVRMLHNLVSGNWWRIPAQAFDTVEVRLAANLLWDFPRDGRPRSQWPGDIHIESDEPEWRRNGVLAWTAALVPNASLVGARLGGTDVKIIPRGAGAYYLERPRMSGLPVPRSGGFPMRLFVDQGGRRFYKQVFAPPPPCARLLRLEAGSLFQFDPIDLTSFDKPVYFFASRTDGEDVPYLFEGARPAHPLPPTGIRVDRRCLAGIGASLTVRSGRYNARGEITELHKCFADSGQIDKVTAENDLLRLDLRRPVDWPEKEVTVEALDVTGALLTGEVLPVEIADPQTVLTCLDRAPGAVALLFRGSVVGAWAGTAIGDAIRVWAQSPRGEEECRQFVHWIFGRKLPVERQDLREAVEHLIDRFPAEALAACIAGGFPSDEALRASWRARLRAQGDRLRQFLLGSQDGETGVVRLLGLRSTQGLLSGGDERHLLVPLFDRLADLDPITAAVVLRAAITKESSMRPSARAVLPPVRLNDDGLGSLATRLAVDSGYLEHHARAASEWGVRDQFPASRAEVDRLLLVPEFRRAVADRVWRMGISLR